MVMTVQIGAECFGPPKHKYSPVRNSLEYTSDDEGEFSDESRGSGSRNHRLFDAELFQHYVTACGNLIINYIPPNLTEEELLNLFKTEGPVENVKIVRKKPEGHSLGYAFVKYVCPGDAQKAICRFNGYRLQNKILKVSVARPSCSEIKDANLYISGIPKHLTQAHLHGTFSAFGTIINCKIITDNNGQSRGIGFVRYNTKQEALAAVQNLNRQILPGSSVPLQVKLAEKPSHRNVKSGMYDEMQKLLSTYKLDSNNNVHPVVTNILKQYFPNVEEEGNEMEQGRPEHLTAPNSVCLYVYNLPPETDRAFLFTLFKDFGEIASVRPIIHYPTMQCKGFGFVNMKHHSAATLAIHSLHGKIINGKPLQVSFKK
ncbi:ELAV-like protein 1 [Bolinopsis microptera]|uniref:ELAV-like protein 1 n=1 Tax=Bolinopsis microptera TaxID=2820187 RepID=UPI0030796E36